MAIKTRFSKKEHTDSGLALLLLTLLTVLWMNHPIILQLAIAEILILLIAPVLLYPFTFLWLNISDLLGKVMSKILLTVIFIILVCPVAIYRRAAKKDSLLLTKFKNGEGSVFKDRFHDFTQNDFTTQY